MDRWQEMKQYLYPFRVRWMEGKVKKLRASEIATGKDLLPLLEEVVGEEAALQEQDAGRKASYLAISYLISGMMAGRHEFLVMMTDDTLYLDGRRVEHPWCPHNLYDGIEEDIRRMQEIAARQYLGVTEEEMQSLRLMVEQDFLALTEVGLAGLEVEIRKACKRRPIRTARDFQCIFGEYMGGGKTVLRLGGCPVTLGKACEDGPGSPAARRV